MVIQPQLNGAILAPGTAAFGSQPAAAGGTSGGAGNFILNTGATTAQLTFRNQTLPSGSSTTFIGTDVSVIKLI
ncbi:hypothetical protein J7E73_13540 [Paenibacillus albidus]|uniref:hypothetical protein n=1 Tax=Paenibacillus albidus TaxID=2041023 RepID=UPI001BE6802D|nr:hypothetical protein [Paenibacillus albidus]MBT2290146.1 hypothetical protein [Paenibacillus albidus]